MIDWMIAEMWRYTVLTFKLFFWLIRGVTLLVTGLLNRNQRTPSARQTDLFEQEK